MPQGIVIAVRPLGFTSDSELMNVRSMAATSDSDYEQRREPQSAQNWLVFIGYNSLSPNKFIRGITTIDTVVPYKGPLETRRPNPIVNFLIEESPLDVPERAVNVVPEKSHLNNSGSLLLKAVLLVSFVIGVGAIFSTREDKRVML